MAARITPSRGGKPDKLMRDALALELHEEQLVEDSKGKKFKVKKLRLVARALVHAAIQGDISAIKEVNDRMDGKPPQDTTLTVQKHDATDWARDELVAIIDDARARSSRASKADGRDGGPDSVH